jgi:ankyrin repeat protein
MSPTSHRRPLSARSLVLAALAVIVLVVGGVFLYRQSLAKPLLKAVAAQDPAAVASLLRRGAPAAAADENGNSALSLALNNSSGALVGARERIAHSLLMAGADPNSTMFGAPNLYQALELSSVSMVRDLLAHGADPNAKYSGSPLLMSAVARDGVLFGEGKQDRPLLTQALLAAGADARIRRPFVGEAREAEDERNTLLAELPLLVAVSGYSYIDHADADDPALTETLLAHGVGVDLRDHNGQTALFIAASKGEPETVRVLLDHKADPSQTDRKGLTPLQAAQNALADEVSRDEMGLRALRPPAGPWPDGLINYANTLTALAADENDARKQYGTVVALLKPVSPTNSHGLAGAVEAPARSHRRGLFHSMQLAP